MSPFRILLSLTLALSVFHLTGQGKVGIGTTVPQTDLHIHNTEFNFPFFGFPEITLSNQLTGVNQSDGLSIRGGFNATINNRENGYLNLATNNIDRLNILADGKIGINTSTMAGAADLTVVPLATSGFGGMSINSTTSARPWYAYAINGLNLAHHYYSQSTGSWRLWVNGERLTAFNDGRVGINTSSPLAGYSLHNQGTLYNHSDIDLNDKIKLQPLGFQNGAQIELYDDDGTNTIAIRANQSPSQGAEIIMTDEDGNATIEIDSDNNAWGGGYLTLRDHVGNNRLVMQGQENSNQGATLQLFNSNGDNTIMFDAEEGNGRGANIDMLNHLGSKTIEIDSDYANSGRGRIITSELEITGGSDLAEYFDISTNSTTVAPGMVVSIDNDHAGSLKICNEATDKKVVGVISGANGIDPGMLMGQKNSIAFGDYPVAIAGRVYVLADDSNGSIQPGDFLTTSERPGYAVKVINKSKSDGAIIGKAMSTIDDNGFVLVLITLQ